MSTTKYIVNNVSGQKINGQSVPPPYKVYTALLTQSGGDDPQFLIDTDNGNIVPGVTYEITNYAAGDNFTNIGAPSNANGVKFVATGHTAATWSGPTELNYNTGAPVVKVLENTIGNIWFTYTNTGQYLINSDSLFLSGKTYFSISDNTDIAAPSNFRMIMIGNPNSDYINIITYDPVSDLGGNGKLTNTPIEIRVYN